MYHDRVELVFHDSGLNMKFVIARPVKAVTADPAEYASMQPKTPFVSRKRAERDPEVDVVPGEAPPAINAIQYAVKLALYPIPASMSSMLSFQIGM